MAIVNPPAWLQQQSYPAKTDRNVIRSLLGYPGVALFNDMLVAQTTTPSMAVTISSGSAYIFGTSIANQGTYHVLNDASVTLPIPASNATNPRIDLVVLRIYDADVTGSTNLAQFEVVQGTPTSSPVAPTRPASSIELARITVPASATSVTTGNISTAFKARAKFNADMSPRSGIDVLSSARPATPYLYQQITETDTGATGFWDGTSWVMFDSRWQTYTPRVFIGTAEIGVSGGTTLGNAVIKGRYFRSGKKVAVQASFTLGSTTAYGGNSGNFKLGYPFPSAAVADTGYHTNINGIIGQFRIVAGASVHDGMVLLDPINGGTTACSFQILTSGPAAGGVGNLNNYSVYAGSSHIAGTGQAITATFDYPIA